MFRVVIFICLFAFTSCQKIGKNYITTSSVDSRYLSIKTPDNETGFVDSKQVIKGFLVSAE